MSLTNPEQGSAPSQPVTTQLPVGPPAEKITQTTLRERKRAGIPITALTAYDYPTARLLDAAGIDLVLVGDSVGMAVLGHPDTLSVTVDEMLHHTRAVRRGLTRAMLVADMPFGSYHTTEHEAVANAIRFIKEAGAEAVKLEGGANRAGIIARITEAEIPVVGHLGLTPQSLLRMGGYRVQAKSSVAIDQIFADAHALQGAGVIALVLEGIPREVATELTRSLDIPTVGIGAGPGCDGQILVLHDLASLTFTPPAKFVRRFTDAGTAIRSAAEHFRDEVLARTFPSDRESYHLPADVAFPGHAVAAPETHAPDVASLVETLQEG